MTTPLRRLFLRVALLVGLAVCAGSTVVAQSSAPELKPGAILTFEFPELSENLANMFSGEPVRNVLVAQLPDNYTRAGRFPMIVYLDGGHGGVHLRTGRLREAVGPNDFICVRLPLFKQAKILSDPAGGKAVLAKDHDVISRNYRVMFQKLFDTVPNITPERSVLGGFSNGAHTTAVLLERGDEFILRHFSHFYLAEGGLRFGEAAFENPALGTKKLLFLLGDRGRANPFEGTGPAAALLARVRAAKIDVTALPMRGYGHELPVPYLALLRPWAVGEPLPGVPPKAAPPAGTEAAEPAAR